MKRRAFIHASATTLAGLALPALTRATELSGDLRLIALFGANVLAVPTDEGLVLVDSGPPGAAADLEAFVAEAGAQVHTLFNTHWHMDQCGGNEVLGRAGARIVAHEKTRLHLGTDHYIPPEERYHRALPAEALPVETFYDEVTELIGGQHIDYGYLPQPHTDGDIYVFFRDADVLAVGDVASPERDPAHDWYGGGWIGGRVDAMDRLLALAGEDTLIVPAYGPLMTRAALQAERDMMDIIYERMVDLVRQGRSARDMLREGVLEGLGREWNDPYKFLYDAHKGLWAHHNKLAPNIV